MCKAVQKKNDKHVELIKDNYNDVSISEDCDSSEESEGPVEIKDSLFGGPVYVMRKKAHFKNNTGYYYRNKANES